MKAEQRAKGRDFLERNEVDVHKYSSLRNKGDQIDKECTFEPKLVTKSKIVAHSKYLNPREEDSVDKPKKFSGKIDDEENCCFKP